MANAVVSRIGQIENSGDAEALFLTKYAGEVLMAFRNKTKFLDKHMIRTVEGTNAAQFPIFGYGGAEYHVPGQEILGEEVPHNEQTLNVDQLLIAPRTIAKIDEAMNHYDVRAMYSADAGRSLALQFDSHVAQVAVLAARSAALISTAEGGSRIFSVDPDEEDFTDANSIAASLFVAQTTMDEKNIPEDERYAFLRPAQYQKLVYGLTPVNRDFGGNGNIAKGSIYELAGFQIVKTNQLPSANITTGPALYRGDFSTTVGLCMHTSAVGTVKLMDLSVESGWDMRRQVTLIIAKYAMGHGILRPEAAVELTTAAS